MKGLINIGAVNFTTLLGDKEGNLNRIPGCAEAAGKQVVEFLVFPETTLTGYDNDLAHERKDKMHCVLAEPIRDRPPRR